MKYSRVDKHSINFICARKSDYFGQYDFAQDFFTVRMFRIKIIAWN